MEKHVVSLEIAKQLKEVGWKKETEFWWAKHKITFKGYINSWDICDYQPAVDLYEQYSAPLATEILEEIKGKVSIQITYSKEVGLRITDLKSGIYFTDTLPNALAQMWLYLKKEGKV